jgi:hypothetical protein
MPSRLLNGGIVGPFQRESESGIWSVESSSITGPVYTPSINGTNFNEGDTVIVSVSVTNLSVDTTLTWQLTGAISTDIENISGGALTGANPIAGTINIDHQSGTGSLSFDLTEDLTTEGVENWVLSFGALDSDDNPTNLEYTVFTLAIQDTSISQQIVIDTIRFASNGDLVPTDATGFVLKEGTPYYAIIESYNYGNTEINWSISPGFAEDFNYIANTAVLSTIRNIGNDTIYDWRANFTPTADFTTEGSEVYDLIARLSTDNTVEDTASFTVTDSSLSNNEILNSVASSTNEGSPVSTDMRSIHEVLYYSVVDANNAVVTDVLITIPNSATQGAEGFSDSFAYTTSGSGQRRWDHDIDITPTSDLTTEGNKVYTIKFYSDSNRTNEILELAQSFTVVDTSVEPLLRVNSPTSNTFTVAEGTIIEFDIESTGSDITIRTNNTSSDVATLDSNAGNGTVFQMIDDGNYTSNSDPIFGTGETVYKRSLTFIAVEDAISDSNEIIEFDILVSGTLYTTINVTITDTGLAATHTFNETYSYLPFVAADTGTFGQEENDALVSADAAGHQQAEPFADVNTYLNGFGIGTNFTSNNTVYDSHFAQGAFPVEGVYEFVVGRDGRYRITCEGADGGGTNGVFGRRGIIEADFFLKKDEVLYIVAGRRGGIALGLGDSAGQVVTAGGGGMSAVFKTTSTYNQTSSSSDIIPLIVAGGGGGINQSQSGARNTSVSNAVTDVSSSSRTLGFPGADGFGDYASGTGTGGSFGGAGFNRDNTSTSGGYGRPGAGILFVNNDTSYLYLKGCGAVVNSTAQGSNTTLRPFLGGTRAPASTLLTNLTSQHNNGTIACGGFGGGAGATSNYDSANLTNHFRGAGGGGGYSGGGAGCGGAFAGGALNGSGGGGSNFYSSEGSIVSSTLGFAFATPRSGRVEIELLDPGTY